MRWFRKRRSKHNAIVAAQVAILKSVYAGVLDDHPCPKCGQPKVSAWFMRARGSYYVLCICAACGYEFQTVGDRPPSFAESRVHKEREKIWRQGQAMFPRPDCDDAEAAAEQGDV